MTQSPPNGPSSKMVRCQRHGLFYNPETADGCPVCHSAAAQEQGGLPFSPVKVALTLGTVALVFFVGGRVARGLAAGGAESTAQLAEDIRLSKLIDPELHRQQLVALEDLVYRETAYPGIGSAIMEISLQLSEEFRGDNLEERMLAQELLFFGQNAAQEEDIGYAAVDLTRTRELWEEIRSKYFRTAGWFKQ